MNELDNLRLQAAQANALARPNQAPGTRDDLENTALHEAASAGDLGTVKALLAAGADIEARDADGCSALYIAAWMDHEDVARVLIEAGANRRARSRSGMTPFDVAMAFGHRQMAHLVKPLPAMVEALDSLRERWPVR